MDIAQHMAALGDKLAAVVDEYKRAHNLRGTVTFNQQLTEAPTEATIRVQRSALVKALQAAKVAMSREETRYSMCGVLLEVQRNRLHVVGCDGHRLAETELPIENVYQTDASCIVDGRKPKGRGNRHSVDTLIAAVKSARGHGANRPGECTIVLNASTCRVHGAEPVTTIDGTYPDWRRVLPRETDLDQSVTFQVADMLAMLDKVHAWTKGETFGAKIVINTWHAEYAHGSDASRSAQIKVSSVGNPRFGINSRYLADAIKGASTVTIRALAALGPMSIECGDGVRRVIMPMRV